MDVSLRKKLKICQILGCSLVVMVLGIYWLSPGRKQELWKRAVEDGEQKPSSYEARTDLAMISSIKTQKSRDFSRCIYLDPSPNTSQSTSLPTGDPEPNEMQPVPGEAPQRKAYYPEDPFTLEQRRHGWVLLHFSGMIYMFIALAIVFEEFFIPALGITTEKLNFPKELARANFLAAGGFAPEIFISFIGLFLSRNNVGIGAIVGSGLFNVLAITGTCAAFSDHALSLVWWPLLRDGAFYAFDLLVLVIIFVDEVVTLWESSVLLLCCAIYVVFLKYNKTLEETACAYLLKNKDVAKMLGVDERVEIKPDALKEESAVSLRNCTSRKTIYQLIIHATKPFETETVSTEVLTKSADNKDEEHQTTDSDQSESSDVTEEDDKSSSEEDSSEDEEDEESSTERKDTDEENCSDEPLSLTWPQLKLKQIPYILLLPIIAPLWITLPDVRKHEHRKFFVGTFLGSLLWIGLFSYFSVWLAHRVSETLGISDELMSLSVLATGISAPNLITSVLIARKGLGGIAVSNSVGINVFDINIGLPVPWLIYSVLSSGRAVPVNTDGLFFIIVVFILTLVTGVCSAAAGRWRMNRTLGLVLIMIYFFFLLLSLMQA